MSDRYDTAAQLRKCIDPVREDLRRAYLHGGFIEAFAQRVALLCAAAEVAANELDAMRRRLDVREKHEEAKLD